MWDKLQDHWKLVEEYNKKFNLTAIHSWEDAEIKHYQDCLQILPLLQTLFAERQGLRAVDIGSGAGFPGLVLAIGCPETDWLLLEANGKKCEFLRLCIERLGIKNASVKSLRAEDAGRKEDLRGQHDLVVARAVSGLPVLLEYAAPLLAEGGVFAAMKGPSLEEEQVAAGAAQEILAMSLMEQQRFELTDGSVRFIATYKKIGPTGEKYPRRAGVPEKRPLHFCKISLGGGGV